MAYVDDRIQADCLTLEKSLMNFMASVALSTHRLTHSLAQKSDAYDVATFLTGLTTDPAPDRLDLALQVTHKTDQSFQIQVKQNAVQSLQLWFASPHSLIP